MSQAKTIKYLILSTIVLAGLFFIVGSVQAIWYNSSWTYRREISIDPAKIDDDLTNFPTAVMFSSSTVDFTHFKDNGEDVRFTSSDGETLIDFEQERFASTTDGAIYWVEIPSVSSSTDATTTFFMYYGNAAASDGQNATGTWNSDFKGVYHLKEDPTPDGAQIKDSTSNGSDGTSAGTMTSADLVDGKIGKAIDFDGTDDLIEFVVSNPDDYSIEMWIDADVVSGDEGIALRWWSGDSVPLIRIPGAGGNNEYEADVYYSATHHYITTSITADTWNHWVLRLDGTAVTIWKDGTQTGSGAWSYTPADVTQLFIGADLGGGAPFNGILDELRVSDIPRSNAWIKASYNSGNDSLLSFGAEEEEEVAVRRIMLIE